MFALRAIWLTVMDSKDRLSSSRSSRAFLMSRRVFIILRSKGVCLLAFSGILLPLSICEDLGKVKKISYKNNKNVG